MISLSQTAYGTRFVRHGRSRALLSNHAPREAAMKPSRSSGAMRATGATGLGPENRRSWGLTGRGGGMRGAHVTTDLARVMACSARALALRVRGSVRGP